MLSNGKVLVTGGRAVDDFKSAELYDPLTETWTTSESMNNEQGRHTASILKNGRVLVAGGSNDGGYLDNAELYIPY